MLGSLDQGIRRSPTLASQVHRALCEAIASGKLVAGERIVVEGLAERLGVSATPVREAIAGCIQDGLIQKASDGKLQIVPLTRDYVLDVFLVRGALEGLATELAATRITDEDLDRLQTALDDTTAALSRGAYDTYIACDALLHGAISAAAGSRMLGRELDTLQVHVAYIRGYAQRHAGDHMRLSHEEHQRIVAALAQRDAAGARRAMEEHIHRSGERIARLIEFDEAQGTHIGPARRKAAGEGGSTA